MNFYNNIFVVVWKHFAKFEMNLTTMGYPKSLPKKCNQIFHYSKDFLKDLKWFEIDIFWEIFNVTFTLYYNVFLDHKSFKNLQVDL
jgi:hypothetical protein